jgi:hypothetical protein
MLAVPGPTALTNMTVQPRRLKVKRATITMLAMCALYLVCNLVDFTVKIIEKVTNWFETDDGESACSNFAFQSFHVVQI